MPRASWRGFLRLSLVSCPIYLSPATTRTKPIRLHQVWRPAPVDLDEDELPDRGEGQQGSAPSARRLLADDASPEEDQSPVATRVSLRPHDPATGEEIDKREVVKGYEYARGEFVTFTAEELKALDGSSSMPRFPASSGSTRRSTPSSCAISRRTARRSSKRADPARQQALQSGSPHGIAAADRSTTLRGHQG